MYDYGKTPREQEPVLRELLDLGIGYQEIADITGWNVSIIRDSTMSPNRPTRPNDVFVTVLRRYAKRPENEGVRHALAEWLQEDSILGMLRNVAYAFGQLEMPNWHPEQEGYARLMGDIFNIEIGGPRKELQAANAERWWNDVLIAIRDGREKTPTSHKDLSQLLLRRASTEHRGQIKPAWDDLFKHVDQALAELDKKSRLLLIELFGLNGTPKAAKVIAEELGVTATRVNQRKRVALDKLHRAVRTQQLQTYGMPIEWAFRHERTMRMLLEEATQLLLSETAIPNPVILFRSVDELTLSRKARNCMWHGNIKIIGELIQRDENSLLRTTNFGRKSLEEIKKALLLYRLTFGMQLSREMNELFERYRNQILR